MEIKYKGSWKPEKGTSFSAGFDLKSSKNIIVHPGETILVPTGIAIEIPTNYFGIICSRSGLAANNGIFILNAPGIIDADYRGEIKCIINNCSKVNFEIKEGMKIAQLIILPLIQIEWIYTKELSSSIRGNKGFGSTGTI